MEDKYIHITSQQVARFLEKYPEFFEEHATLLANLRIPDRHGGRAISLLERQVILLRDKTILLEEKLAELIYFAEENDQLHEKMHRLTLSLMSVRDRAILFKFIEQELKEIFQLDAVSLKVWGHLVHPHEAVVEPSIPQLNFANQLHKPLCGRQIGIDPAELFADPDRLKSFACVGLKHQTTQGILSFGSHLAEHYHPQMDTLYLKRMGELITETLLRFAFKK